MHAIAQLVLRDDVIIQAAIVAHNKRRTRFTLGRPRLFGTELAQWIRLGELPTSGSHGKCSCISKMRTAGISVLEQQRINAAANEAREPQ